MHEFSLVQSNFCNLSYIVVHRIFRFGRSVQVHNVLVLVYYYCLPISKFCIQFSCSSFFLLQDSDKEHNKTRLNGAEIKFCIGRFTGNRVILIAIAVKATKQQIDV